MMKKGIAIAIMFFFGFNLLTKAQEETLMTINGKAITKAEFVRIYKKNNNKDNTIDSKSLEEYLDLFINFKLKVMEAENLKMDTVTAFIKELAGYKKQLAKPYLTDQEMEEVVLKEAYERMKYDIHAAHILLRLDPTATPEDTLKVYKRIMDARKRIVEKGEDFGKVAKEITEDEYGKKNGGDLGYFTAFRMIYSFETCAYSTKPGEVSMPVRTSYGYHLLKIFDKRESPGKVKVAHIMVAIQQDATKDEAMAKKRTIDKIYNDLKSGADFKELAAKHSDDKNSSMKGGELAPFGTGQMVPQFEDAAFNLNQKDEYTAPIRSNVGWHIIKLIEKQPIGDYEDLKSEIKSRISRDARANKSKKSIVNKLKLEYNFKHDPKRLEEFYNVVDTSIFAGSWDKSKAESLKGVLFTLDGIDCNQSELTEELAMSKRKMPVIDIKEYLDQRFEAFVEKKVIEYEETKLEAKYPDFRYLMQEYHDGILLFELTDKMVWTKAVKDTVGLTKFHNEHKNDYMWDKRVDASIYVCPDDNDVEAVRKLAAKRMKKGYSVEEMKQLILKATKDSVTNVKITDGKYLKGSNDIIDKIDWTAGLSENSKENNVTTFVCINAVIEPEPKTLNESRGLVTADYQTFLEAKWIEELRKKYIVEVDKAVLSTIK